MRLLNDDDVQCSECIGEGGFGEVCKALWQGKPVAVKKLKQKLTIEERAAFFHEVELHSEMDHPNVVQCYGALSSMAIIMERGEMSLEHYLRYNSRNLDLPSKIGLMVSSCLGVKYLHNSKIVHRDIKSSNFLVFNTTSGCEPVVKITDFGLAVVKTWSSRSRTASPAVGSKIWMAPELFEGGPHNKKSDIFSFGIVLFEIVATDRPYWSLRGNPQILRAKNNMEDPCYVPQGFPEDLLLLMRSCIQNEPQKRPTITDVFSQLDACYKKVSTMDMLQ